MIVGENKDISWINIQEYSINILDIPGKSVHCLEWGTLFDMDITNSVVSLLKVPTLLYSGNEHSIDESSETQGG